MLSIIIHRFLFYHCNESYARVLPSKFVRITVRRKSVKGTFIALCSTSMACDFFFGFSHIITLNLSNQLLSNGKFICHSLAFPFRHFLCKQNTTMFVFIISAVSATVTVIAMRWSAQRGHDFMYVFVFALIFVYVYLF